MKTVIVENTFLKRQYDIPDEKPIIMDFGWGNGYALIPIDHPLFGRHYDDINEHIDIHGGLTFSSFVNEGLIQSFGIDPEYDGYWCVGFDTCHYQDTLARWPKEAVQIEADELARQLELFEVAWNNNL